MNAINRTLLGLPCPGSLYTQLCGLILLKYILHSPGYLKKKTLFVYLVVLNYSKMESFHVSRVSSQKILQWPCWAYSFFFLSLDKFPNGKCWISYVFFHRHLREIVVQTRHNYNRQFSNSGCLSISTNGNAELGGVWVIFCGVGNQALQPAVCATVCAEVRLTLGHVCCLETIQPPGTWFISKLHCPMFKLGLLLVPALLSGKSSGHSETVSAIRERVCWREEPRAWVTEAWGTIPFKFYSSNVL